MKIPPSPFYIGFALISIVFIVKLFSLDLIPKDKYNPQQIEYNYQHSHLLNPSNFEFEMFDWDLYAYTGYKYITTGDLSLNFEHPPFGKYLYGLSIIILGHQNYIQIIYGYLLIIILYIVSIKLFSKKYEYLAVLPSLLLLFDGLFWYQVKYTLLDLPLILFIILFICIELYLPPSFKKNITLGIVLGLVAGIKFMVPTLIFATAYFISKYFANGYKKVFNSYPLILFALFTYLLIYSPIIINQGILKLFTIHFDAVRLHISHVPQYPMFVPLRVIFLNQWPIWWNNVDPISSVSQWNLLWPISTVGLFISPLIIYINNLKLRNCRHPKQGAKQPSFSGSSLEKISKNQSKKNNKKLMQTVATWSFPYIFAWSYFIFINTRLFFPSYLLILLPFFYLLLIKEGELIFHWLVSTIKN